MKKICWLLFLLMMLSHNAFSIEEYAFRDSSGTPMLWVSNAVIKDNSGRILYSFNESEVFYGTKAKRRFIFLRVFTKDIFADEWAEFYGRKSKELLFYAHDGGYYYQPIKNVDKHLLLAYWRKNNIGGYSLFHGKSDSLLAYYDGDADAHILSALFHHLQLVYGLQDSMTKDFLKYPDDVPDFSNTSGTIWHSWNYAYDYIWDGHKIIPRWYYDADKVFEFDGYFFQRENREAIKDGFVWEDNFLKWRWRGSYEYVWDGKMIKSLNKPNASEYIIYEDEVVPLVEDWHNRKWFIEGDVPIPVIIFVVYVLSNF